MTRIADLEATFAAAKEAFNHAFTSAMAEEVEGRTALEVVERHAPAAAAAYTAAAAELEAAYTAAAKRARRRERNARNERCLPVRQAVNLLSRATTPVMGTHRERLVRTRPEVGGSYVPHLTSWGVTQRMLRDLDWGEIPWDTLPEGVGAPYARYFRAEMPPGTPAFTVTMTAEQARRWGYRLEVRVGKPSDRADDPNPRGLAVWAVPPEGKKFEGAYTREVWAICSAKPGGVLWTWHPGRPAVPVVEAMYEALDAGEWDDPGLQEVNVHL